MSEWIWFDCNVCACEAIRTDRKQLQDEKRCKTTANANRFGVVKSVHFSHMHVGTQSAVTVQRTHAISSAHFTQMQGYVCVICASHVLEQDIYTIFFIFRSLRLGFQINFRKIIGIAAAAQDIANYYTISRMGW